LLLFKGIQNRYIIFSSHRNSSPTPTNEFESAKEFIDQLPSGLVKQLNELVQMTLLFRNSLMTSYLAHMVQPVTDIDLLTAMTTDVLKVAARWALAEQKKAAGGAAGSAHPPPPPQGQQPWGLPPPQQGLVWMLQQPQQGGAPPQQQQG
jgi:hypothetical protein